MTNKSETGKLGEEIAKKYLELKGYKIIDRNYKTKFGEIDLVCKKGKRLIIIEVRTKKGLDFGTPEESLNRKKLKKILLNQPNVLKQRNLNILVPLAKPQIPKWIFPPCKREKYY